MKLRLKIVAFVVFNVIAFGYLGPYLLSERDTFMNILTGLLAIVVMEVNIMGVNWILKKVEKYNEK